MTKSALSKLTAFLAAFVAVLALAGSALAAATVQTLPNGVRLVLAPTAGPSIATVEVLYGTGSSADLIPGTAHFVEHMVFRGTAKRPTSVDITRNLDRLGADYNASTSKDTTQYYVKLGGADVPQAVEILFDMLTASVFRETDMNIERGAVLQEESNFRENTGRISIFNMLGLMYPGSPASTLGLGTADDIKRITAADLVTFVRSHYVPANTIVAVAGSFNVAAARRAVLSTFGNLPVAAWTPPDATPLVPSFASRIKHEEHDGAAKASLAIGFPGYTAGETSAETYELDVLAQALGGTMGARLFTQVRDRLGLAYSIGAWTNNARDNGQIVVTAGVDADRLEEAIVAILAEVKRFKDEPVPADELAGYQAGLRFTSLTGYETTEKAAHNYAYSLGLKGRLELPGEYTMRTSQVTVAGVQVVAHKVLLASRLYLSVVVPPRTKAPDYEALIAKLGE